MILRTKKRKKLMVHFGGMGRKQPIILKTGTLKEKNQAFVLPFLW